MAALARALSVDSLTQGSVVDDVPWGVNPAPLGIVLTNACDFEWEKASYVVVAALGEARAIIQASSEFRNKLENVSSEELSKRKWTTLANLAQGWINNSAVMRYFTVDAEAPLNLGPLCVDFQWLLSMPINEAKRCRVVAQLPSPDREHMIVHFSAYVSRIAVDRLDDGRLSTLTAQLCSPYRPVPGG